MSAGNTPLVPGRADLWPVGAALPPVRPPGVEAVDLDRDLGFRIDALREAMESEMAQVRDRCVEYLRWYSPPWNRDLARHDAWDEEVAMDDLGLTRGNFPISRAVVDIWTSLESGRPPSSRAEPERIAAPPPLMDEIEAQRVRSVFEMLKTNEGHKADMRSWLMRTFRRKDQFTLKNFRATRRKNLYGFSWVKVVPHPFEDRPYSHPVRNPTAVFPLWSSREPDDIEAVLCAYQENAGLANAKHGLGLRIEKGAVTGSWDASSGRYRTIDDSGWTDASRTMLWVEEYWWVDRTYEEGRVTRSRVGMARRICDKVIEHEVYEGWRHVPFVPFQNSDERDSYGWSDLAGVLDINDEVNRRMSQEGDIIGMYASPRFQLLGGQTSGLERDMPGPFEMIALADTERIEQILTRIDMFPSQVHFQTLIDLLHRVTGLPPIVWGLIANAQTSGRALTASWKATETRLIPKLMSNESSLRRWDDIVLDYVRVYDWEGARDLFRSRDGKDFNDFRWEFPPMEPRDFQEVAANAIMKRDAGAITTVMMMREIGDEAADDTLEGVRAENLDPILHPDKRQAWELLKQAEMQNIQMAQQLGLMGGPGGGTGDQPMGAATVAQAIGASSQARPQPSALAAPEPGGAGLPPTQPGANGNVAPPPPGADPTLTSGTLMRQGTVSNQFLATNKMQ